MSGKGSSDSRHPVSAASSTSHGSSLPFRWRMVKVAVGIDRPVEALQKLSGFQIVEYPGHHHSHAVIPLLQILGDGRSTSHQHTRLIEAQALASLWTIAGNAAPRNFDVTEARLVPDTIEGGLAQLDHYRELALKNRPEARLADAGARARKVQEKLARTSFLPDLGVVVRAGYGFANKATTDMRSLYYAGRLNYSNIYFGLAMNWNIQFHNDAFALQRARAQRREAEYKRDAARALLLLEVEQAYRALLDAEQQLRYAELARDKSWKLVVSEQTSGSIGTSVAFGS